jgi:hypothetical protein
MKIKYKMIYKVIDRKEKLKPLSIGPANTVRKELKRLYTAV